MIFEFKKGLDVGSAKPSASDQKEIPHHLIDILHPSSLRQFCSTVVGLPFLQEMLFCSTVVGLPFLLPPMILTGELFKAWNSCYQHPYVYGVLVFEAATTFVGQVSVLSLIAILGAATTAMIRDNYSKKSCNCVNLVPHLHKTADRTRNGAYSHFNGDCIEANT